MARPRQTKAEKQAEARIEAAYYAECSNVTIDMLAIPRIFAHGNKLIAAGADDAALRTGIRDYVAGGAR